MPLRRSSTGAAAQVQYVLPLGTAKNGAQTAIANDWEAIGINPANLGWDNNNLVSVSFLNIGASVQSAGLNMSRINTMRHSGDTNQPSTAKQILGGSHGTNLFADASWFAGSVKLKNIGAFAISIQDRAMANFTLSPGGADLITRKGRLSDSLILHSLNGGTSVSLTQYREFNLDFGRELFDLGHDNSEENEEYYVGYNVRQMNYEGKGNKNDTAAKDDNLFRVYGGIGLKYLWGGAYLNGTVGNSSINADYSLPNSFPTVASYSNTPGHGIAADIGVSATYKKWRFGISATDLGSIVWRQSSFTVADTTIFGLNSLTKVINKLDSNKVADFSKTTNVTMSLPSKLRFGASYQLNNRVRFSSDIIFPLNNVPGNLAGPYFALGTDIGIWKILIINLGVATTTYYGTSVPLGVSLCIGHAVQFYAGTSDILTYLGKVNNGNVSAAFGMLRINIRGKHNKKLPYTLF